MAVAHANWRHWLLWAFNCGLLSAVTFYPVSTRFIRLAILALIGGITIGLLRLTWRKPFVRWPLLLAITAAGALVFGPGPTYSDMRALHATYLRRLQAYEGVRYYWGGENSFGIDCSGLVRRGMIDALLAQGIRNWDSTLVRKALSMWWNDTSALELRENATLTTKLQQVKSVNDLDPALLKPGDMASNGTHIMAYLGDRRWIEADPGENRVITVDVPADNGWFQCPMTILRWTLLTEPKLN
ncbi:NlpC/P60 family protein [Verrucomicrobiota bacterium sgz303538]